MTIVFKCSCGRGIKVPDEAAGKKVKCADCGNAVRVPAPKATKQKVKAAAPLDEDDYGMDFGLPEDDIPTELPPRKSELEDYVPKKKKKSSGGGGGTGGSRKKKQSGTSPAVMILAVVLILGLVGGGGFFAMKNLSGGPAQPIEVTYSEFNHPRGEFSVQYPSDWEKKDSTSTNAPAWATFEDGTAYISVRTNAAAAAIADIGNSMMGLGEMMTAEQAEQAEADSLKMVHQFITDKTFANEYGNYEETPGEMIQTDYGPGWLVEFTGTQGFGGKQRGYRLTLKASSLEQLTVLCKCPNNRWERYEPVLSKVVRSIGPLRGQE